jgi:hypothetical protein
MQRIALSGMASDGQPDGGIQFCQFCQFCHTPGTSLTPFWHILGILGGAWLASACTLSPRPMGSAKSCGRLAASASRLTGMASAGLRHRLDSLSKTSSQCSGSAKRRSARPPQPFPPQRPKQYGIRKYCPFSFILPSAHSPSPSGSDPPIPIHPSHMQWRPVGLGLGRLLVGQSRAPGWCGVPGP